VNGRSGISRRAWLGIALGGAATALIGERWWRSMNPAVIAADATPITVYASPSCACCHTWIAHLEENRFHVTRESVTDVGPVKRTLAIPESLWSCHTGMVAGYAVEGHVPADLIQKLLADRPAIAGLAVPGMPSGSPGMEAAIKDRYEVISFTRNGDTAVYAVR
jgi:hypothetical protein